MVPPTTTKGKILTRLSPDLLDIRLASELGSLGFNSQINPPVSFASAAGEFGPHEMNLYKKGETAVITFSTATDNPTGDARLADTALPRCTEVFEYMKSPEFQDNVEKAIKQGTNPPIHVYLPIITVYGNIFQHKHFRGISLDVSLEDGKVKISKASLINSRNAFFGSSCPDGVRKGIEQHFGCECESVFTGQQSILAGDNDSCGYRVVSYGAQLAKGTNPHKLIDDVKCSTKFIAVLTFLPKLVWAGITGIGNLFAKKPQPLSQGEQHVTNSPMASFFSKVAMAKANIPDKPAVVAPKAFEVTITPTEPPMKLFG